MTTGLPSPKFHDERGNLRQRKTCFWKNTVKLNDDEWWLARFCELRNAIVHGDDVRESDWIHEGDHHLAHAHDALIRCLMAVVAEHVGDELLKLTRSERALPRAAQEAAEMVRESSRSEHAEDLYRP